jgi:phosphate-selective porin
MKRNFLFLFLFIFSGLVNAQVTDSLPGNLYFNVAERLLHTDGNLKIGGYGGIHYNQPVDAGIRQNGKMDVHRFIMLLGYSFSNNTQFISEIEFEHVKEVYIEQAFLQHKINNYVNFRAGLMLTPMGITNEYHEPNLFRGVERPLIDNHISPTTWREIGAGFMGYILPASLKYQAYLMNGFLGYNGSPKLSGSGLRSGRQKGAESIFSSPNFAGKVEYFGIRGLNLGASVYAGNTQSTLYNGVNKNDQAALATADSSVVGLTMIGLDARYSVKGLQLKGQYYYAAISNTEQYNRFTAKGDGTPNDLGSSLTGFYIEAAYNVFRPLKNVRSELTPFIRYEKWNTQNSVEQGFTINQAYDKQAIVTGLEWEMARGALLKADMQFVKAATQDEFVKTFNAGVGIMF